MLMKKSVLSVFLVLFLLLSFLAGSPGEAATPWLSKQQLIEGMNSLANEYSDLVKVEKIGSTVQDNDVLMFRIGNNPSTKLLIDGAHHGHEMPGSHNIYFLMQWLLGGSLEANMIINRIQILLVPIVNYDNVAPPPNSPIRTNANHVDLNRNYVKGWGGGSSNPASDYYRGPNAASEPETQAMRQVGSSEVPKV